MDALQQIDFQVSLLCIAMPGNPPVRQIEAIRAARTDAKPSPAPLR
jgi:hypothetical protein